VWRILESYAFPLSQEKLKGGKVKAIIKKTLFRSIAWEEAGHGRERFEGTLRLSG